MKNWRSYSSLADKGFIVLVMFVLFLVDAKLFGVNAEAVGLPVAAELEASGEDVVVVLGFN